MSTVKVNVIFHSLYGHVYRMAEAVAEGAREVGGVEVNVYQVPETLPGEVLAKMGAVEAKKAFAHVPEGHTGPSGRSACRHIWHTDPFRHDERTDARLPGQDGATVGTGSLDRKGGQRIHLHRHPARGAGSDDTEFPHHPLASRHDYRGGTLFCTRALVHGGALRRRPLWSQHYRGPRRESLPQRERVGHRSRPGRAGGRNRETAVRVEVRGCRCVPSNP